jgi:hypothetical protein
MEALRYTVEAAAEYGIGGGVNGTGKRRLVRGFYVMTPHGRKARAFTGSNAEIEARKWAEFCNENFL